MTDTGKWLAGSVPFVVAVFGFLGVTDGEVTRILVNFRGQFVVALTLVLLAAALGALVPAFDSAGLRIAFLGVGTLLLLGGLVWMAGLAAESGSANERPRVATKLAEGQQRRDTLTAEVGGAGLTVDEHLAVTVTGRPSKEDGEERLLYGARVGPDSSGNAVHSLEMPVDTLRYGALDVQAQLVLRPVKSLKELAKGTKTEEKGCNEESRELACVTVYTPRK